MRGKQSEHSSQQSLMRSDLFAAHRQVDKCLAVSHVSVNIIASAQGDFEGFFFFHCLDITLSI